MLLSYHPDVVVDAANVEAATKNIIEEAEAVGKTAAAVVSEATEIARVDEKLQNDFQQLIEKCTELMNKFLESKGQNS